RHRCMGGPEMAPQTPSLVTPRGTRGAPRFRVEYIGPEMAPQTPRPRRPATTPRDPPALEAATRGPSTPRRLGSGAPHTGRRSERPAKTPLDPPTLEAATRGRSAPG